MLVKAVRHADSVNPVHTHIGSGTLVVPHESKPSEQTIGKIVIPAVFCIICTDFVADEGGHTGNSNHDSDDSDEKQRIIQNCPSACTFRYMAGKESDSQYNATQN